MKKKTSKNQTKTKSAINDPWPVAFQKQTRPDQESFLLQAYDTAAKKSMEMVLVVVVAVFITNNTTTTTKNTYNNSNDSNKENKIHDNYDD